MSTLLWGKAIDDESFLLREPRLRVVRGLAALMEIHSVLVDLAERSGQLGAVDYLRYFLTGPYIGSKVPYVVLVSGSLRGGGEPQDEDLLGAVIVQEYQILGSGSGIFMTDDEGGDRTVLAPRARRAWVAAKAAEGLLDRGAKLILLSLQISAPEAEIRTIAGSEGSLSRFVWGWTVRKMDQYLPLLDSVDATFGTLGKHTRRNLRYYRRRAEEKLGCTFVPRVGMSRPEFLAVNRVCSYPVPDAVARWRYDTTIEIAGGLFAGVQAGSGDWLSLVGGRHHHSTTAIAWQMNREQMVSYSLSTVMRSYLLQHEVERGTRRVSFDGGTPHSMHHAFVTAEVAYVVTLRRSVSGALLRRSAASLLPENNFLRRVLLDSGMCWHSA